MPKTDAATATGESAASYHANRSIIDPLDDGGSVTPTSASVGDKSRRKANLAPRNTATAHNGVLQQQHQQQHLITNVLQIVLSKWSDFGHFSCHASNQVGQQKEACKWHILPLHHYSEHSNSGGGLGNSKHHHHLYHHKHHQQQQQQSSPSAHHSHFDLPTASVGLLNNCQIIESSNAVVIKCHDAADDHPADITQDFLARIGNNEASLQPKQRQSSSTIDRNAAIAESSDYRNIDVEHRGIFTHVYEHDLCTTSRMHSTRQSGL